MNKKELKQKVAEVFANKNITTKSQYIRDLIEKEVKEDMTLTDKDNLISIKDTIYTINQRQVRGYETFNKVCENIEKLDKNIFKVWAINFVILMLNMLISYKG